MATAQAAERKLPTGMPRFTGIRQTPLRREAGKPIPLGAEMMNEIYLPYLDFYQARAWGQPCSTLETWPFREQIRSGQVRMIPLFDYVYHEYGAVRMDGWGKLVNEIGSLFYHTVAKVYLWGGPVRNQPRIQPNGRTGRQGERRDRSTIPISIPSTAPMCRTAPCTLVSSPGLRLGAGNPYLAYGRDDGPAGDDDSYNHVRLVSL